MFFVPLYTRSISLRMYTAFRMICPRLLCTNPFLLCIVGRASNKTVGFKN